MKILLLGSGGREHALAWKIAQSAKCEKLFIAPGNAGTVNAGENVNIGVNEFDKIKQFTLDNGIDMYVDYNGQADYLWEITSMGNKTYRFSPSAENPNAKDNTLFDHWDIKTKNRPGQPLADQMAFGVQFKAYVHMFGISLFGILIRCRISTTAYDSN